MTRVSMQLGDDAFGVRERSVSEKSGDHEPSVGIDLVPVWDAPSVGFATVTIADGARYLVTGLGRIAAAGANSASP